MNLWRVESKATRFFKVIWNCNRQFSYSAIDGALVHSILKWIFHLKWITLYIYISRVEYCIWNKNFQGCVLLHTRSFCGTHILLNINNAISPRVFSLCENALIKCNRLLRPQRFSKHLVVVVVVDERRAQQQHLVPI